MQRYNKDGSRISSVRSELEPLVADVGVEPVRAAGNEAAGLLERDGAVILGGYPLEAASTVRAAQNYTCLSDLRCECGGDRTPLPAPLRHPGGSGARYGG